MHGKPEPTPEIHRPSPQNLGPDQAVLFIAASEIDANLYYACHFLASDPIAYVEFRGERILLLPELELGRGNKEARVDRVVSTLPFDNRVRESGRIPQLPDILELFFKEIGILRVVVPASFPIGHADRLRERGIGVEFCDEPFYPQRTVKSEEEIAWIAASQAAAEEAMELAIDLIRKSRISGDHLELDGRPLTAEMVRLEVHRLLFERNFLAQNTIIAGGEQACDPHVRGSGPLAAHRPIVLDIFPRSIDTRYWGDISRTVVRGRPAPEVEKLYQDVLESQEMALSLVRDGADAMALHQAVMDFFKSRGRATAARNGRMEGYIHSTGHGVGLDIHELPKIGRVKSILKAGNVVTIEPGLYYSGLGGARVEDTVLVTAGGHRNLTRLPKNFIL